MKDSARAHSWHSCFFGYFVLDASTVFSADHQEDAVADCYYYAPINCTLWCEIVSLHRASQFTGWLLAVMDDG